MIFLKKLGIVSKLKESDAFPFNLKMIRRFKEMNFGNPVTFFVGDNGSGKSTLLEGLAASIRLPVIGSREIGIDATLRPARKLGDRMQLAWNKQTRQGFFLRAEDVFGFTQRINASQREMEEMESEFSGNLHGYGRTLAVGAIRGQRKAMAQRYGENLDANSHGETFIRIMKTRLVPDSLYLLDEPETPLSFKHQLSLLILIGEMVKLNCQFIIATHSPVLTKFPDATIFNFDFCPPKKVSYEEIEQFSLLKSFLDNPGTFLCHIFPETD